MGAAVNRRPSCSAPPEHVATGAPAAFALCRPPGHHAHRDLYGGYCFLNNAALAAQGFRDPGAERVAILDVDFHHGNGTQDIFYRRKDVLFCSLHGQPQEAFPYFLGFADENRPWRGRRVQLQLPDAARHGLRQMAGRRSTMRCGGSATTAPTPSWCRSASIPTRTTRSASSSSTSEDFSRLRPAHFRAKLPTLFVMEGGYAIEAIGINVVNVLRDSWAVKREWCRA